MGQMSLKELPVARSLTRQAKKGSAARIRANTKKDPDFFLSALKDLS